MDKEKETLEIAELCNFVAKLCSNERLNEFSIYYNSPLLAKIINYECSGDG